VVLLFLDDGYRYLLPLILFNNFMDDLDGVLAAKLAIRSRFGADLDNVCDGIAHVTLALAVGAHFGGMTLVLSTVAAGSVILRVVSRVNSGRAIGGGSPTNELMRHLLFTMLLAEILGFDPETVLIVVFPLHSLSMLVSFRMSALIRAHAKSVIAVGLVNAALALAWLTPVVALSVAAVFLTTYLYSLIAGGGSGLGSGGLCRLESRLPN
jgi:phosphatidylglycerophosphate synthase